MAKEKQKEQDSAIAEATDHWQAKLQARNDYLKTRLMILTRKQS